MNNKAIISTSPDFSDLASLRVGIHRTRYLGDILLLIPLLKKLLSAGCDKDNLYLVVNEGTEFPLTRLKIPFFSFRRQDVRSKFLSMQELGKSLRARTFDLWIDLTVSDRSRLATGQVRSVRKIGAASAADRRAGDPYDLFVPFDYNHGPGHVSTFWTSLLSQAGIRLPERPLDFLLSPDPFALEEVKNFLAAGPLATRPLLVLHPGARHWFKRWPPDRFSRIAEWWARERGGGVVLTGTSDESSLLQSVMSGLTPGLPVVVLQQSVPFLHALLCRSDLFIGNDSGPLHLARSAGAPSIALFGSTSPDVWGLLPGEKGETFYRPPDCSPCDHSGCTLGRDNCLRRISVNEVQEAMSRIAGRREVTERFS